MAVRIAYITILVRDQDEALSFYTEKLGWEKREEDVSIPGSRWLTVAPTGQMEVQFSLRKAKGADLKRVGRQVGGQYLCTLMTENCRKTYDDLQARGVKFVQPPHKMPFGVVATFEDLYGNHLDLWESYVAEP